MFSLLSTRTLASLSAKLLSNLSDPSLYCRIWLFLPRHKTLHQSMSSNFQQRLVWEFSSAFKTKIFKYVSKRYALFLLCYICQGFIPFHNHALHIDRMLSCVVSSNSYVPNAIKNKQKRKTPQPYLSMFINIHTIKYDFLFVSNFSLCIYDFGRKVKQWDITFNQISVLQ